MEKILVVYWSMTGNTEMMANAMVEGLEGAEVTLKPVSEKPSIDGYDKIMFGCSACGVEELDDSEFDPYFSDLEKDLTGKKIALFGSHDWGDGEFMRTWEERSKAAGAIVFGEGLTAKLTPDDDGLQACRDYAKKFLAS